MMEEEMRRTRRRVPWQLRRYFAAQCEVARRRRHRTRGRRRAQAIVYLRHTQVDALACPCGERRAIVADISDNEVLVAVLAHLGPPTEARARIPAFELA
jgi:hypothetical protein